MSKFLAEKGIHCEVDRDVKNINRAVELIERMLTEDYCSEEYNAHRATRPDYRLFEYINDPEFEEYREELSKISKKAHELHQKDKRELFDLLNNHIEEWWD
jgi:uncharacterized protein with ATP-grasp and redox domains